MEEYDGYTGEHPQYVKTPSLDLPAQPLLSSAMIQINEGTQLAGVSQRGILKQVFHKKEKLSEHGGVFRAISQSERP